MRISFTNRGRLTAGLSLVFLVMSVLDRAGAQTMPTGWHYPTGASWSGTGNWLAVPPNYTTGLYHLGRDIGGSLGSAVYAMADGTVEYEEHGGDVVNTQYVWLKHHCDDGSSFYAIY